MDKIPYIKKMTVSPQQFELGMSGYQTVTGYEVTIELDRDKMVEELDRLQNPPSPKVFCQRIRDALRERLERETGLEPDNVTSYAPWYRGVARIQLRVPGPFYEGVMSVVNTMVVPPGREQENPPPTMPYHDSGQYRQTDGPYADSDNRGRDDWWRKGASDTPQAGESMGEQVRRGKTVPSISLARMVAGLLEKPELRIRPEEPNEPELCREMAREVVRKVEKSYAVTLREPQKAARIKEAVDSALRDEYVADPERRRVIVDKLAEEIYRKLKGASIEHTR